MGAAQDDLLTRIDAATERPLGTVRGVTDADVRQVSLLPGWSQAHVLAHFGRGTDACHGPA
jgi:hypothetical protein